MPQTSVRPELPCSTPQHGQSLGVRQSRQQECLTEAYGEQTVFGLVTAQESVQSCQQCKVPLGIIPGLHALPWPVSPCLGCLLQGRRGAHIVLNPCW